VGGVMTRVARHPPNDYGAVTNLPPWLGGHENVGQPVDPGQVARQLWAEVVPGGERGRRVAVN
jgi:hypothetical protein